MLFQNLENILARINPQTLQVTTALTMKKTFKKANLTEICEYFLTASTLNYESLNTFACIRAD